jgi:hypothetical protein
MVNWVGICDFSCCYNFRFHCMLLNNWFGVCNMLKKLQNANTSWSEFFLKFPIVFFFIMPVSMGGCFWIGFQFDSLLNIHILKIIFPVVGLVVGLYLTALFILLGHAKEKASATEKDSHILHETGGKVISTKSAVSRPGYFTAFQR